ncbi:hypothetical protein J6590_088538 [Homalodisca vitripennis]|nr:hypothetical protein J6590_088538 [Homalodisca vitripennis]
MEIYSKIVLIAAPRRTTEHGTGCEAQREDQDQDLQSSLLRELIGGVCSVRSLRVNGSFQTRHKGVPPPTCLIGYDGLELAFLSYGES